MINLQAREFIRELDDLLDGWIPLDGRRSARAVSGWSPRRQPARRAQPGVRAGKADHRILGAARAAAAQARPRRHPGQQGHQPAAQGARRSISPPRTTRRSRSRTSSSCYPGKASSRRPSGEVIDAALRRAARRAARGGRTASRRCRTTTSSCATAASRLSPATTARPGGSSASQKALRVRHHAAQRRADLRARTRCCNPRCRW